MCWSALTVPCHEATVLVSVHLWDTDYGECPQPHTRFHTELPWAVHFFAAAPVRNLRKLPWLLQQHVVTARLKVQAARSQRQRCIDSHLCCRGTGMAADPRTAADAATSAGHCL